MSFFKKLADHARQSNNAWLQSGSSSNRSGSSGGSYSSGSAQCCANCRHFEEYTRAGANVHYRCRMHNVEFNASDVYHNQLHYKKTCNYFQYK